MPQHLELNLTPEQASDDGTIKKIAKGIVGFEPGSIRKIKQSVDARRTPVMIRLVIDVYPVGEDPDNELWQPVFSKVSEKRSVVIIGFGPAGMFAALRL